MHSIQIVPPQCTLLKETAFLHNPVKFLYFEPECIWENAENASVIPPACTVKLPAAAGVYKFKLFYYADENCSGERLKAKSNEFRIMASAEIIELCEEKRLLEEEQLSDPLCQTEGFICVDGWGFDYYYDSRLAEDKEFIPRDFYAPPEELEKAIVSIQSFSYCSCDERYSYHITAGYGLENLYETECETYYSFIKDYNSACNGCLELWSAHCC